MTPETVALLVVDAQRGVLATCIRREETIANVQRLVEGARRRGLPVIWARHHDGEHLTVGSDGWQLLPDLVPRAGESIIDKAYADAFAGTALDQHLRRAGVTRILLCGAQTDACIRGTFYGGLHRGYPVTLVADAHTTEDLRPWGATFSPEQSIDVLNLHAADTVLPEVAGAVVTTAEAFGSEPEPVP